MGRGYLDTEFFLKCELYYCAPPQNNFHAAVQSPEVMKEEVQSGKNTVFKLVQTRVFQFNRMLQGLSTLVPISFDREFTSICLCSMHGSMIDFRFRVKSSLSNKQVGQVVHKDGDTFLENGILVELKYVDLFNEEGVS